MQDFQELMQGWPPLTPALTEDLTAIGHYLNRNPEPPWFDHWTSAQIRLAFPADLGWPPTPDPASSPGPEAYLGAAAILMAFSEAADDALKDALLARCPIAEVGQYLAKRAGKHADPLPDLPLPQQSGPLFQTMFRDWANGIVSFLGPS